MEFHRHEIIFETHLPSKHWVNPLSLSEGEARATLANFFRGFRKNENYEIEHSDVILTVDNSDFTFLDCAYEELLQSLGLRAFSPSVTACPGCGRTTSSTFQELAERVQDYIREQMPTWKTQYTGVETMTLAVMGCVVNGPGESKAANIGISLPGTGEAPNCPIFIDGQHAMTLRGTYEELAAAFQALVDDYVATRYPRAS